MYSLHLWKLILKQDEGVCWPTPQLGKRQKNIEDGSIVHYRASSFTRNKNLTADFSFFFFFMDAGNLFLVSLCWQESLFFSILNFQEAYKTMHPWRGHVPLVRLWSGGESELAQGWSPRLSPSLNERETQYKGTLEGAFVLVDSPPLAHLSSFDHVGLLAHLFVLCLYLWGWCERRHFLRRPKYPIHLQCFPLQGHSNPHRHPLPPSSCRSSSGDRRKETILFLSTTRGDFSLMRSTVVEITTRVEAVKTCQSSIWNDNNLSSVVFASRSVARYTNPWPM